MTPIIDTGDRPGWNESASCLRRREPARAQPTPTTDSCAARAAKHGLKLECSAGSLSSHASLSVERHPFTPSALLDVGLRDALECRGRFAYGYGSPRIRRADVPGLDCNALGVNGADVRVLKDSLCRGRSIEDPRSPTLCAATAPHHQVGLCSLLQSHD